MKKIWAFALFIILANHACFAQVNKYFVFLNQKDTSNFEPIKFFAPEAIERRIFNGLPLNAIDDIPVDSKLVGQIATFADSIGAVSRWFNMVTVYTSENNAKKILNFPFVDSVIKAPSYKIFYAQSDTEPEVDTSHYSVLRYQTDCFGGSLVAQQNLTGKGVKIAVFDGGFPGVDKHEAFSHLRPNIVATYDFVLNKEFAYHANSHGTSVLSNIGGISPKDGKMGLAPDATFMLARTEQNREPFSEEENWLAASEWADQKGAHIISSSLGYGDHRYFPSEMLGRSFVARAANRAASKGILVINAAGNEGDKKPWKVIITPADADSVLAVGGVKPNEGYKIDFSSVGHSALKTVKPNVCAPGMAYCATPNGYKVLPGTSFATPLTSGFAAAMWQSNMALTAAQMFEKIQQSGHLYPSFDFAHGYGIPQASRFLEKNPTPKPTFTVKLDTLSDGYPGDVSITALPFVDNGVNNALKPNHLFVQDFDDDDKLVEYKVYELNNGETHKLARYYLDVKNISYVKIYYNGYIQTFNVN